MCIEKAASLLSSPLRRAWECLPALLLVFAAAGLVSIASAQPLYVQRAEAARPDSAALAEALKKVREHRDLVIRDDLKVPPFHKRLENPLVKGEAFCQQCHLPLPHAENARSRSFLNMHSRFIACETCHFRPKDVALDYRWLDYLTGQKAAAPGRFRTGYKHDNAIHLNGNPKIAPFVQTAPAITLPGSDFARRVADAWKAGDAAARARFKARLHAPLEKEGPPCARCHTDNQPMLDLAALGASPEQATAIRRHLIPRFFAREPEGDDRLKILDILR